MFPISSFVLKSLVSPERREKVPTQAQEAMLNSKHREGGKKIAFRTQVHYFYFTNFIIMLLLNSGQNEMKILMLILPVVVYHSFSR